MNTLHKLSLLILIGTLTACAPKGDNSITVEPSPLTLTADSAGRVEKDLTFRIPRRAMSRRSRLVVTPVVEAAGGREEMTPLVIDRSLYNKKKVRRMVLEQYVDPYALSAHEMGKSESLELPYTLSATLPSGQRGQLSALVTEDGCGACTSLDTLQIATIEPYVAPVKARHKVVTRRPRRKVRQKVETGEGVAHLQFVISRYDIRPEMANNRAELEKMAAVLGPVLNDTSAQVLGITISGVASVDGPLGFNTTLALNRARSAREWLCQNLSLCEEQANLITIGSRPEGWTPVIEAMEADHHPDAPRVREIVEQHKGESDDVAERIIRRLPVWRTIANKYLQPDRKVTYTYSYTRKGVTEEYDDYDDMEEIITYVEE